MAYPQETTTASVNENPEDQIDLLLKSIPLGTWWFLGTVGFLFICVAILILYLEKVACFKICNGRTCFDLRMNVDVKNSDALFDPDMENMVSV